MSTTATPMPDNHLWGIYYTDREYAREMGDPLRTVVEAPTKTAAEEVATQLGFSNPWAHPVTPELVKLIDPMLKRQSRFRHECGRKSSPGIRI